MSRYIFSLLACALACYANPSTNHSSFHCDISPTNYSSCDPAKPPTSLKAPHFVTDPYLSGILTQPSPCVGDKPSKECISAISKSNASTVHIPGWSGAGPGGHVFFARDSGCSSEQRQSLETAFWDAINLASWGWNFPWSTINATPLATYYMGSNYNVSADTVSANFNRTYAFTAEKEAATQSLVLSCVDTRRLCSKAIEGQPVGSYAWTYTNVLFDYYYVTVCPAFFTMGSLSDKLAAVKKELADGDTTSVKDATMLANTGMAFLHQMMHIRPFPGTEGSVVGDEYVDAPANTVRAYGAQRVAELARRSPSDGGGAATGAKNANSYAVMMNAAFWWEVTGYFPGVPQYPGLTGPAGTNSTRSSSSPELPIMLNVLLSNSSVKSLSGLPSYNSSHTAAWAAAEKGWGNGRNSHVPSRGGGGHPVGRPTGGRHTTATPSGGRHLTGSSAGVSPTGGSSTPGEPSSGHGATTSSSSSPTLPPLPSPKATIGTRAS